MQIKPPRQLLKNQKNLSLTAMEKHYKNGILTFLDYQMKNWTEKHLKIK